MECHLGLQIQVPHKPPSCDTCTLTFKSKCWLCTSANTLLSLTQYTTQQPTRSAYKNNTRINRGKATFVLLTEYAPTQIHFMTGERQTCAVTFTTLPVHTIAFRGQILISRRGPWIFKDMQPCGRERDLWPLGGRRNCALRTAGRFAHCGSEDVKLYLTTMGPSFSGDTIPSEDFSYENVPVRYNSSQVSNYVECVSGTSKWFSEGSKWVTGSPQSHIHSFTHSHKPPLNKFPFTIHSSSIDANNFSLKASKPLYLLQVPQTVSGDDHRKYCIFI